VTTTEIKVRSPEFDFTDVEVVWGPNAEAVIGLDAGSPIITPIEIFLVKVMRMAKAQLDPVADAELIRDIDLFNRQEVRHYKTHAAFNKAIREWCPAVVPLETAYSDEMDAFVAEKPLRWLLGYCEGFEAIGGLVAPDWVDGWNQELAGSFSSTVAQMFRWHLAEEYEHRTVVYRLYHRLFGEPADEAHEFRVEMFGVSTSHFFGFIDQVRQAMLERYREGMTPEELAASEAREAEVAEVQRVHFEQRVQPVFAPSYDPAGNPAPENLEEVLSAYPLEAR
jgi:predicted metal-dependent hydrolase